MRSLFRPIAACSLVLPSIAACTSEPGPGASVVVRDSAGIRIVENANPASEAPAWTVSPIFRVGWEEGELQLERVARGHLMPDGSVMVSDGGTNEIHILSGTGHLVTTFGGDGEGPGEFRGPAGIVGLGGDTVLIADSRNNRVSTFAGNRFVGDTRFIPFHGDALFEPAGRLPDGTFALEPYGFALRTDVESGWMEQLILTTPDFIEIDTVGTRHSFRVAGGDDDNPLRHFGIVRLAGDRFVYAQTDRAVIEWIDPEGNVVQLARFDWTASPATDSLWALYEAWIREQSGDMEPERLSQVLADRREDFEGPVPFFRSVLADRRGNVWLGDYHVWTNLSPEFDVIAADGTWIGPVGFPGVIQVLDITDTHVLGIERNDLDVQAVVLYSIEKGR